MMEQGLAGQMSGVPMGPAGGDAQAMLEQVIQLLAQGVNPEELLQQGIPMEIIQQAIDILLAEDAQMQNTQQPPQTETGLAMTMGV